MRAITVRQPWAWAINHGGKDVENRSRNIAGAYRGPVAIHAGLVIDLDAEKSHPGLTGLIDEAYLHDRQTPAWRGALIGVVDLVHVHPDCTELVEGFGHSPTCSSWAMPDHYHLVLENPRPLAKPIPYKGALGLWTLPDDVLGGAL